MIRTICGIHKSADLNLHLNERDLSDKHTSGSSTHILFANQQRGNLRFDNNNNKNTN